MKRCRHGEVTEADYNLHNRIEGSDVAPIHRASPLNPYSRSDETVIQATQSPVRGKPYKTRFLSRQNRIELADLLSSTDP